MTSRGASIVALTLFLAVTGFAANVSAAQLCKEDGDCKGVLLCREGHCVQVHCKTDAQCPAGRMCHEELCRMRQCYRDGDCTVDRLCDEGFCVKPQPRHLEVKEPVVPGVLRIVAGPQFPLGAQLQADVPLGDNRWVMVGLGTSLTDGGVSWRIGMRGAPMRLGPMRLDIWAAAMGYNAGQAADIDPNAPPSAAPTFDALGALLGSGRSLFAGGRDINAVWWGGGGGLSIPHGKGGARFVRLDFGLALLFDDVYPTDRDFALLPTFGLQYGWQFNFAD